MIVILPDIEKRVDITVQQYHYSEPNYGKDICDRIICPLKGALKRYCDEGNDILNVNDMHTALRERPVRGATAHVCSTVETNRRVDVQTIKNFDMYLDFNFQEDVVKVWKSYAVCQGKLIPCEQPCKIPQKSTGLDLQKDFFDCRLHRNKREERVERF